MNMAERFENIDELFRGGLKDFASEPPAEIWGRIEKDIVTNRRKVIIPAFLRIAAGIILLAGITWIVWKSFNSPEPKQVLSEINSTEPSNVDSMSELTPSDNHYSSVQKSTPENSTKETIHPVIKEASFQDVTLKKESITSKNTEEKENVPDEFIAPENTLSPATSREVLASFDSEKDYDTEPLINQGNTEIDYNELIMQQNLLALESQKDAEQKKGPAWSVGGQAGPQYTYRDVYVNTPSYPVSNYNEYESGLMAYSGGLQFEVEPTHRFSIQSGVYYSKIGQTKSTLELNSQISTTYSFGYSSNEPDRGSNLPDVVNSTGNITFDKNLVPPVSNDVDNTDWSTGLVTAEQYFEYVEIPFIFRYLIVDKKLDINLCSGIWANFLVGNKAVATDNRNFTTKGETEDINTFGYSGSFSVGLAYPVVKNIDISLEPFFKYYLSPINTNPETSVYPYSLGVLTGISYSF